MKSTVSSVLRKLNVRDRVQRSQPHTKAASSDADSRELESSLSGNTEEGPREDAIERPHRRSATALAWPAVSLIVAAKVAFRLATSGLYGAIATSSTTLLAGTTWRGAMETPAADRSSLSGCQRRVVDQYRGDVQQAGTLGSDGKTIDPQERGNPIWICRNQKLPWSAIWP